MILLIKILAFFWLIRTLKIVLFWIYLWQLKEYHVGRFLDHFSTYKGKRIFLNFLQILKLILLAYLLIWNNYLFIFILYVLLVIYILESLVFLRNFIQKNIKSPKFTFKTTLLTLVSFTFVIIFLIKTYGLKDNFSFVFSIFAFDIFVPLIISCIVLIFQPIFVLGRNRILKKAREKISKHKKLIVIGITGSYGKTSTKEFLTTILSSKFNVLSTKDHQNSEIGIAQCILNNLNDKHRIFVVEMGSYKKGGIKLLCDMVKPKIGIVTGVNDQHLALFGSMENLISAEGGVELMKNLPKDGLIVVNGDNKYCLDLYKKSNIRKKIYTLYNNKIESDIFSEEISVDRKSISFIAITNNKEVSHFNVGIIGKQNIQNILGAVLVAEELGMNLQEISTACKNITQKQAGITIKSGIHDINIIDSSYSSNPDGVMADLDYLNVFSGRKIIIMPCLIELGGKSSEIHREIGKKISEVCDMAIITTKEKFEEIKNGAVANGALPEKIIFSDNSKEIFHLVTTFCKKDDVVLLEGRVPEILINKLTKNKDV